MSSHYIGRFAPSPTGPLHFGSLVSALASFLDAKSHQGQWLIRIEDVDSTRCKPRYSNDIIACLESYGLISDCPIIFQSERGHLYEEALDSLRAQNRIFACNCTRQQLTNNQHPQVCLSSTAIPHSWRFLSSQLNPSIFDGIQGKLDFCFQEHNNPVLKRKDDLYAYQLAVVVDDHWQGITHVVRGADLLDTTSAQLQLYDALGWSPPIFSHIPVIVDANELKISKQNHAKAIPSNDLDLLKIALSYLGIVQSDDHELDSILESAITQWPLRHQTVTYQQTLRAEHRYLLDKSLYPTKP